MRELSLEKVKVVGIRMLTAPPIAAIIASASSGVPAFGFRDFTQLVHHVLKWFCDGELRFACFNFVGFIDGL
jgi:hypothetical protein